MSAAVASVAVVGPVEFVEVPWCDRVVRIEHQWITPQNTDAPLLVFLHEGLGSLAMWKDFPRTLCEALGVRGLVYSRAGYGRSTPRDKNEAWGLDFMHQQAHEVLPALLQALNIDAARQPLCLFGHSDGASIALLFAARFPQHAAGVVVLAPHLMVEDIALDSIAQARCAYTQTQPNQANLRERLAKYHDDVDSAFFGWNDIWLHPAFKTWSIEEQINTITCPVLAVQGADDEYGTMAQMHCLQQRVTQTELLALSACGHSPQRDQPQKLIVACQEFFQRHHQETFS